MQVDSVVRTLQGRGPTILFFDGIADFADDLQRLLAACAASGTPCIAVAVESFAREHIVVTEIDEAFIKRFRARGLTNPKYLSSSDATSLLSRLKGAGRYLLLQGWSTQQQLRFLVGREIFDALSEIEYGAGFRNRFGAEIDTIFDARVKSLAFLVSLLYGLGYPTPLGLVGATGIKSVDLDDKRTRAQIDKFVRIEDGELWPRYRSVTTKEIQDRIPSGDIYELLVRFTKNLSPYITKQTLRGRSIEYRLAKGVMRARSLYRVLGLPSLPTFYERLQNEYGTVAQFWEQRAIAAELLSNWPSASSFAAKAVDLAPNHAWRLTNFGRILLLRSYQDAAVASQDSWDLYDRGRMQLETAQRAGERNALPLLIAFHHSAELYRRLLKATGRVSDVEHMEDEIRDLYRDASQHPAVSQTAAAATVHDLYSACLALFAVRDLSPDDPERESVIQRLIPRINEETDLLY